jgi:hypothetical protein
MQAWQARQARQPQEIDMHPPSHASHHTYLQALSIMVNFFSVLSSYSVVLIGSDDDGNQHRMFRNKIRTHAEKRSTLLASISIYSASHR